LVEVAEKLADNLEELPTLDAQLTLAVARSVTHELRNDRLCIRRIASINHCLPITVTSTILIIRVVLFVGSVRFCACEG
jgi:hypothetical protein